jgi:hypothetical protein
MHLTWKCLLTLVRGWSFDEAIWTDEVIPKDNKYATKYVPQTRAFIVSNDKAVVLVFRGAHALPLSYRLLYTASVA